MTDTEINLAIAGRARAGEPLSAAELTELDSVDVLSLGMLADEVRRARVGSTVTYTRVFEPDEAEDEGLLAGLAADGVEFRLAVPEGTLDDTATRVARTRAAIGAGSRLTGYSLADLVSREWAPLVEVLAALRAAGLDAIAEAPLDVVTTGHVDAVAGAGLGLDALSVQRMPAHRVPTVLEARAWLTERPWVRAFAPLSREQPVAAPTTGYHDVRMVALARLALPSVKTIQVDWQQYGPKLAQVALTFGVNHLDRVSPVGDPSLGPRRASVEDVRRNISAAGFTPAERGITA